MDFATLVQECAPWVAHETMAAIVRTESAFRPLAIGVNGGATLVRQPQTKTEAVATAKWLISNGYNIDVGLGQVNSTNLAKFGLSIEDAFDPCKNVAVAATILQGNYQAAKGRVQGEQAALYAALSAYNTGSFSKGFSNGYVQRVVNNAGASLPDVTIPLVGAKAPKPAVKLHSKTSNKLSIPATVSNDSPQYSQSSVYSTNTNTNGVMVY